MSVYVPDAWVIIKIHSKEETTYRVLAGWYGGYLGADSWKINSGITSFVEDGDTISFSGYSGSTYKVHRGCERFTNLMGSVFSGYAKQSEDTGITIEHLDFDIFKQEFKAG